MMAIMAKSGLSDKEWREIYDRVQAGEMLRELDREHGFSDGTVAAMLSRRFGYKRRYRKPSMSRKQSDELHQRLLAGESINALAAELGMPNNANLYNLMRRRYGYEAAKTRRPVWGSTVTSPAGTDAAYMAGIIDGEGSIIKANRSKNYPNWIIKVSMTDRPLIEWLHSFGGTVNPRPSKNPRWQDQWCWQMSRQIDVQLILTAVLPYLRIKRGKAVEALAFFEEADPFTRKWNRGGGNPRGAIATAEDLMGTRRLLCLGLTLVRVPDPPAGLRLADDVPPRPAQRVPVTGRHQAQVGDLGCVRVAARRARVLQVARGAAQGAGPDDDRAHLGAGRDERIGTAQACHLSDAIREGARRVITGMKLGIAVLILAAVYIWVLLGGALGHG